MAKSLGLLYPLSKFAIDGQFVDDLYADVLLDFIANCAFEEPDSHRRMGARWFLLESQKAFFFFCEGAGIDAEKLRQHLKRKIGANFSDSRIN